MRSKKKRCAAGAERRFHKIVLARGDAAGEQEHIGLKPLADQVRGGFLGIVRDGQHDGFASGSPHLRRQRISVRIADLMRGRGFGHGHDLVSGGDDRYAGAFINFDDGMACRRQPGDCGVVDARALLQHVFTGAGFAAARGDVRSGLGSALGFDRAIAVAHAVFHHDHGIDTRGHRRTGHDLDGFSGLNCALEPCAGPRFADDAQTPGHIRGV